MVTRKKGALAQAKGEENTSPRRSPRKIQGVSRRAESAATEHQELVPPQDNPGQLLSCAVLTGRCNAEALMRAKRRNSTPQVHSCTAAARTVLMVHAGMSYFSAGAAQLALG